AAALAAARGGVRGDVGSGWGGGHRLRQHHRRIGPDRPRRGGRRTRHRARHPRRPFSRVPVRFSARHSARFLAPAGFAPPGERLMTGPVPDLSAAELEDLPVHATEIEAAAERLESVLRRTPLELSPRLSSLAGVPVWLKREDLQSVRSYRLRGAHLFLDSLDEREREAGVVAASAGNHAQGVARACRALGIHGRIYVPSTTPRQKRDRITSIGGDHVELQLVGETFDDAAEAAAQDADRTGATLVPPFDHPMIMAGQGTVALEAADQLRTEHGREMGTMVVPVGGGGLLGGCGAWLRECSPSTRII